MVDEKGMKWRTIDREIPTTPRGKLKSLTIKWDEQIGRNKCEGKIQKVRNGRREEEN